MTQNKMFEVDGEVPPPLQLMNMIIGQWVSQVICSAARLGIADMLRDSPRSASEIADAIGGNEDGAYRLMRALTSVGVLSENDNHAFNLTEIGQFLRSDIPGSMNGFARFVCNESHVRVWNSIDNAVLTGQPGFESIFGTTAFEFAADNPTFNRDFNDAMTSASQIDTKYVLDAYDFSGVGKLVDVGGGHGFLLAGILDTYTEMQGVLFDMPHVAEGGQELMTQRGFTDRCEIKSGNFLESLPAGDAFIMKYIIHDWDDESAITILKNCRKAIDGDGRILVVDMVVPAPNEPHLSKIADIEMLVATPRGRERTEEEFRKLFEAAEVQFSGITPTAGHISIIEARP